MRRVFLRAYSAACGAPAKRTPRASTPPNQANSATATATTAATAASGGDVLEHEDEQEEIEGVERPAEIAGDDGVALARVQRAQVRPGADQVRDQMSRMTMGMSRPAGGPFTTCDPEKSRRAA